MKEEITAKAYAHAIYDLASENGIDIAKQMVEFNILINENNYLENLLFLEVFSVHEKLDVVKDIFIKAGFANLLQNFINFLLIEKRINFLPLIYKELVVLDDSKKGFIKGTVEGYSPKVDEKLLNKIKEYLKNKLNLDIQTSYLQNKEISAGVRVTVGDLQLDASLEKQLNNLREDILNN